MAHWITEEHPPIQLGLDKIELVRNDLEQIAIETIATESAFEALGVFPSVFYENESPPYNPSYAVVLLFVFRLLHPTRKHIEKWAVKVRLGLESLLGESFDIREEIKESLKEAIENQTRLEY